MTEITDTTDGMIERLMLNLAQFRRERDNLQERLNKFDCCMCGSPMEEHTIDSGHSPVSMYDYELDQAKKAFQASKAKILALIEALEPFARHIGKDGSLVVLKIGNDTWTNTLTTKHFAVARAALEQAKP